MALRPHIVQCRRSRNELIKQQPRETSIDIVKGLSEFLRIQLHYVALTQQPKRDRQDRDADQDRDGVGYQAVTKSLLRGKRHQGDFFSFVFDV